MYHLIFVVKIKNIMKVCIIGSGLTSLTLAKTLVNQGIYVDVFSNFKTKKLDKSRTLSISKSNIDFYNSNVLNIERLLWKINQIKIYNKFHQNEKILKFNDKNQLFSVVKNFKLYNLIISNLKKSPLFKIKKIQNNEKFIKKNYKLVLIITYGLKFITIATNNIILITTNINIFVVYILFFFFCFIKFSLE